MKILFDTNTPAPLAWFLKGHQVSLSGPLGWSSLENGNLLDVAEKAGFELLVTCDQNIPYQQNFTDRKMAVLIISTNHWPSIRLEAHRISTAVDFIQTSQVVRIQVNLLAK